MSEFRDNCIALQPGIYSFKGTLLKLPLQLLWRCIDVNKTDPVETAGILKCQIPREIARSNALDMGNVIMQHDEIGFFIELNRAVFA